MVSDRVPGVPLVDIYKEQLRVQLVRMRKCEQRFIGRVKKSGGRRSTYNIYQRLPIIPKEFCCPFSDEKEFDEWRLAHALSKVGTLSRFKWTRFIERE